jgi:hypothetical protein
VLQYCCCCEGGDCCEGGGSRSANSDRGLVLGVEGSRKTKSPALSRRDLSNFTKSRSRTRRVRLSPRFTALLINKSHPRGLLNIKLVSYAPDKDEFELTEKSKAKDPDQTLGQKSVKEMKSKTSKKKKRTQTKA